MPAHAEIVIEGLMPSPEEAMVPEGPFGEWTGYYAHGRRPGDDRRSQAVYYRDDPIIFGQPPERPVGCLLQPELGRRRRLARCAKIRNAGIPGRPARIHTVGTRTCGWWRSSSSTPATWRT